ncbi:MAG: tRNA-intron lyase [Candidatus Asgardarchaeia archaeon]
MKKIATAYLIKDRIVVWDLDESRVLYANGFYGKPLGVRKPKGTDFNEPLELSFFEACYLQEKGMIDVMDGETGKKLTKDDLIKRARETFLNFLHDYIVYRYLREKGYVVRPALKFGARFAVYEHGPGIDHAPFIVHVLPRKAEVSAIELVRAGRLATSVRKKFILALISEENKPEFFALVWFKP